MAINRAQKEQNVKELRADLAEIPHAILVDFRGLNVANATDLRRKLREEEATFRVVKNSTALRAIEDLPLAEFKDLFVGQTAIVYTEGDVVSFAKSLREFEEEFETPSFKGGIVDGAPISAEEFAQLAKLPPRDELIGKALYLMNYPIQGLATVLGSILTGVVTVLDQIRDKQEQADETGPVETETSQEEPVEDVAEESTEEEAEIEEVVAAPEEAQDAAVDPVEDVAEESTEEEAETEEVAAAPEEAQDAAVDPVEDVAEESTEEEAEAVEEK
ncbi:MAG TPA: 50S ribosomal protein L10 [Acidobacteriota bacterium]|nr:50S ribosomal protein L10 [Acidobacteriota bacterium]